MAWHLLEKIVEHSAAHSTILGKWWVAIIFVFRIIVVASIGDSVYHDEQDQFVCNAKQPGCKQTCYNYFAPISHIRFWAFQIIITGTPSLIFIIYAMHKLNKVPPKQGGVLRLRDAGTQTEANECNGLYKFVSYDAVEKETINYKKESSSDSFLLRSNESEESEMDFSKFPYHPKQHKVSRQKILRKAKYQVLRGYIVSLVFRTLFEAGCLQGQYLLYGFEVPSRFRCKHYPCILEVECYVSRPIEKTVFLFFMLGVAAACTLINLIEVIFFIWRKTKWVFIISKRPPHQNVGLDSKSSKTKTNRNAHQKSGINCSSEDPPPGYYIPNVEPPSEKYCTPANGFPPIRLYAASFTTSESDVTSDDATSLGSVGHLMKENARQFL